VYNDKNKIDDKLMIIKIYVLEKVQEYLKLTAPTVAEIQAQQKRGEIFFGSHDIWGSHRHSGYQIHKNVPF